MMVREMKKILSRIEIFKFFVSDHLKVKLSRLKFDRVSCYCAFLLRINVIKIILLLLLVYSPAFGFMC